VTLKEEMIQSAREGMEVSHKVMIASGFISGVSVFLAPSPWWALVPFIGVVLGAASYVKNVRSFEFWSLQPDKWKDTWDVKEDE
jgi:hypothetical protein